VPHPEEAFQSAAFATRHDVNVQEEGALTGVGPGASPAVLAAKRIGPKQTGLT